MIDVWSNWVLTTVPGAMSGDTRMAGTRTPSRLKANPLPPGAEVGTTRPSGETVWGGGTWS